MLAFLTVVCGLPLSHGFYYDFDYFARTGLPALDINNLVFSSLDNFEINATQVSESKYPWIAKVVHSSATAEDEGYPYVCTASCIRERVFVTAARCIYTLKVFYTTVYYQNKHRLPAQVFVLPSKGTKQGFDDIGFIVVQITSAPVNWKVVQLYDGMNRTDDRFEWFTKLPTSGYMAVGYATEKGLQKMSMPNIPFNLTELNVTIGLDICAKILKQNNTESFHVPCYHSCTVEQYNKDDKLCDKYHGVEGGAIIEIKSNKLLGVTTWGQSHSKYVLPSGFSVVNSDNFYKDYECAKAIAGDKSVHREPLYWQKMCDKL